MNKEKNIHHTKKNEKTVKCSAQAKRGVVIVRATSCLIEWIVYQISDQTS